MCSNNLNEDNLQLKTTSNGRRPQNIKIWISQQPLIGFSLFFKLKLRGPNQNQKCLKQRWPPMEDDLQWKTTSKERQPQNIKSWISQQPLIEFGSHFKLKLRGPNQNKYPKMKTTSNGRQPQNIKSWISQQPLIASSSNLKLKLRELNQNHMLERKTTTNGRRSQNM